MKKITLVVDEKWLEAINNLTNDVYEDETCTWLSVEDYDLCDECGEIHDES